MKGAAHMQITTICHHSAHKPIGRLERDLVAALPFSRGGFVMALSKIDICDFGWKAPDFALKGVDGKTYALADVRGRRAHSLSSSVTTVRM